MLDFVYIADLFMKKNKKPRFHLYINMNLLKKRLRMNQLNLAIKTTKDKEISEKYKSRIRKYNI